MSKLLSEFNVHFGNSYYEMNDYNVFKDKDLLDEFRFRILESISDNNGTGKIETEEILKTIDDVTYGYELSKDERNYLYTLIDNEVNGNGPLTELLNDPLVTEIMVNSPNEVYIEIDGVLKRDESVSFIDDNHIMRTIDRLLEQDGKNVTSINSMVDARLNDGSRINVVIPPLSKNPTITIRKFRRNITDMETLIGDGALTPYMARFLEAAVKAKLNILISGSTGAGKTSLLNILSNFISDDERIVTIEEVRELNLKQNHVVSLETKSPNFDGKGEITVKDLVYNSLKMRPDRIIIGELLGGEAFYYLQALNTGHDGSLTTLHANSPKEALSRLETMALLSGVNISMEALREYISNALDLVVNISRMKDGKRKVTSISEVVGFANGEIVLKEIFNFKVDNINKNGDVLGEFKLEKYKPIALKRINDAGIIDINDMFR
jgi:pilus assembly protein CpaF